LSTSLGQQQEEEEEVAEEIPYSVVKDFGVRI
jgi:hypothetical protein